MFRASSCPSSGAYQLQQQPLVYRRNVVVTVLLVVVGPAWPRPKALLPPRSNCKPEVATAVYKLLIMGKRMPETCGAVFERRAINQRDWCIWLVDLFEYMMMHGHTNPKFITYVLSYKEKASTKQDQRCSPVHYIYFLNSLTYLHKTIHTISATRYIIYFTYRNISQIDKHNKQSCSLYRNAKIMCLILTVIIVSECGWRSI